MKKWDVKRSYAGTPVEFEFNGEQFKVYGPLPGMPLMELAVAVDAAEDVGNESAAIAAWGRFLFALLGAEQYATFRDTANRDGVPPETIMEIGQWLIEEVTGAPLEQHSPSQELPLGDTQNSTVPSSPPVTPPAFENSPPTAS